MNKSELAIALEGQIEILKQDLQDTQVKAQTALDMKAAKAAPSELADLVECELDDAPAASAEYEQAEAQAMSDLVNDLKAKYNEAMALINELKAKLNEMN